MLAIYASTLIIIAASLLAGRAILTLIRWGGSDWLSGAVGFAALVVVAPFAIRLPGRGTTAALVLAAALIGCAWLLVRSRRERPAEASWGLGIAVAALAIGAASLPFLLNDRIGVLGEGIYTNDHAAQLFWAEWLRSGFGPEPSAVAWGYPIGPQAVAVIAADATGASLVAAFNGLLLAIPALTGLTALAALGELPRLRRIAVAAICALPYLAASFLAQSAFKETAMALFLLAFALVLARAVASPRAALGLGLLLAAAGVLTYSLPGLVWFALAVPIWLALEGLAGRAPLELGRARAALASHRLATLGGAFALVAVLALVAGPAAAFIERIDDIQASAGRLSSPVFPGEALGIWPEGDFRIVRGNVDGALVATALGALAAALGVLALIRRRDMALLAALAAAALVYAIARPLAQIHVEAKALAVMAPLVILVSLRALLAPRFAPRSTPPPPLTAARYALGAVVAIAAIASSFLALRTAPVGFDDRRRGLEALAERIDGEPVAFLGVDRFSGYALRGTLVRAPAGYVPPEIATRPEKIWQQGDAADFDSLEPGKLDRFKYAITTAAAHGSRPPPSFRPVAEAGDYVLWQRSGSTPRSRVLEDERGSPGAVLDCGGSSRLLERDGEALVTPAPIVGSFEDWSGPQPVATAAGGQEGAILAPATAKQRLLVRPGRYAVSLQYHSQVPLRVTGPGLEVELPPSLAGMYLSAPGRGAFWPAGQLTVAGEPGGRPRPVAIAVEAAAPNGLQEALGVERRIWLGDLALTPAGEPRVVALAAACGRYVDRFALDRRGVSSAALWRRIQ